MKGMILSLVIGIIVVIVVLVGLLSLQESAKPTDSDSSSSKGIYGTPEIVERWMSNVHLPIHVF